MEFMRQGRGRKYVSESNTASLFHLTLLLLLLRLSRDLLFDRRILGLRSRRGFLMFLLLGWHNNRRLLFLIIVLIRTILGRIWGGGGRVFRAGGCGDLDLLFL